MKDFPRKIAVDAGVFVALLIKKESTHKPCIEALDALPEAIEFFTTESCLAEACYLGPEDTSFSTELHKLVNRLTINIVPLTRDSLDRTFTLINKYKDLPMDFADGTLVAACETHNIEYVLTVDRRDFSIYRPKHCKGFILLP